MYSYLALVLFAKDFRTSHSWELSRLTIVAVAVLQMLPITSGGFHLFFLPWAHSARGGLAVGYRASVLARNFADASFVKAPACSRL